MLKRIHLSISTKLVLCITAICTVAILVALSLMAFADLRFYKQDFTERVEMAATMLATSLAPALLFQDHDTIEENLALLAHDPHIISIVVYTTDNKVYAVHPKGAVLAAHKTNNLVKINQQGGTHFYRDHVETMLPIRLHQEPLGYLRMQTDLDMLYTRANQYAITFLLTFTIALALSLLLTTIVHINFTQPLKLLVTAAETITKKCHYHGRIKHNRTDEVGTLLDAFNDMMQAIGSRDTRLREHSERLEQIVHTRTQELTHRANYDALTDLPNRYLLIDRLKQLIASAQRHRLKFALLYLDLDHFKNINDTLGHAAGDQLLKEVAKRLNATLRGEDTVSRLGGDEFLILLKDIETRECVKLVATHVIESLETPFTLESETLHMSTSIGIALYPEDGDNEVTLMQHADASMYRAKRKGRGHYAFFDADLKIESTRRLATETALRQAVSKDEFALVFQPQHSIRENYLIGFESLIRWNRPDKSTMMPESFIPIAEEIGIIDEIGLWVLANVCKQVNRLDGYDASALRFAFNISAKHLMKSGFVNNILEILRAYQVAPEVIEIEITENTFIHKVDDVNRKLKTLKDAGITIAIDDFGTGYSSLNYLRHYPVDILKIDGCFIREIDSNETNRGIVSSTIALGHCLNLGIVAEGVETKGQLDLLQRQGCDIAQGFYLSKPLAANEVPEYVQQCLSDRQGMAQSA